MSKNWPPLLRQFSEELGYRVRGAKTTLGYQLFTIDLSSWKLRLTDRTPVIWVTGNDLDGADPRDLMQSLSDVIRERNLGRQIVLVLLDGNSLPFFRYKTGLAYNIVLLGAEEQKLIIKSRRPSGMLLDLISAQITISNLAPYETRAPVTGSRFFGREYEINRIVSNPDTNHAILGIRRIGKTSLLREVERILRQETDPAHVIYLECSDLLSTDDYIREVVRKLNPRELPRLHMQKYVFFFPDFLERMARAQKAKLTFLLDEVDNLVIMQRGDWELVRMLRASANKGVCQYIMAGFREAMREQYMLDSPFYNFAQEVRLSEFTQKQAHELITVPLENLRVRINKKDEVVGRIYEETAGQPNLMQYYCTILLRKLDQSGGRELGPDDLEGVYQDESFRAHLLNSFIQNTQNRDKAIVYAILTLLEDDPMKPFNHQMIDGALRKNSIVMPQYQIDEACDLLTLAGILHRMGPKYRFASPVFTRVLSGSYDMKYLLRKIKEEGV